MRPTPSIRRSSFHTAILALALLLVGGLGMVATLWAAGIIDLPFLRKEKKEPPPDHTGRVPVPIPGRAIPKYTQITRDYLFDPKTGKLATLWLKREQVTPKMLLQLDQVLGRVTRKDKPLGYVFTEDDFVPRGTRPGIVAGIPPGKQAMTIEVDKIKGIEGLSLGDHFDLVAALTADNKKGEALNPLLISRAAAVPRGPFKFAAAVPVVEDAIIVAPVTTRQVPTGPASGNRPPSMKTIREVVMAVDDDEVNPLMVAVALKATITCVARSGRPPEPSANIAGLVAVPVPVQPIPMYTTVIRDHFIHHKTKKPQMIYLASAQVPAGAIVHLDEILGRVTRRDKPAGYVFTEDDFLPKGTRSGVVGGTPPGLRAMTIEADKIAGIRALKPGDHFDVVAAMVVDKGRSDLTTARLSPAVQSGSVKTAVAAPVVQDGVVVAFRSRHREPVSTFFFGKLERPPLEEVVIAIEVKYIAPLAEALAVNAHVTCVARSGHPDDPGPFLMTPTPRLPTIRTIEIITGKKKRLLQYVQPPAPEEEKPSRRSISKSTRKRLAARR